MNKTIELDRIMNILEFQFGMILASDKEYYKYYNIILSNEQTYVKNSTRKPGSIYIVVKFLPGDLNFEQIILPMSLTAVAEENDISVCQKLLYEYVQTFNLQEAQSGDVADVKGISKQLYTLPTAVSHFNMVNEGFRSCFTLSANFIISQNTNPYDIYVGHEKENGTIEYDQTPLKVLNVSKHFSNQLDSQPFYGTNNMTKSVAKTATLVLSFMIYLTTSDFCNRILAIEYNKGMGVDTNINDTFYFKIAHEGGFYNELPLEYTGKFKIATIDDQREIGGLPVLSVSFTN